MTVSVLVVAGSLTSYSILQGIPIGLGRMALFGAAEIVRGIVGLIAVGSLLAAGWRSVPGLLVAWGLGCLAAQALVTFYAARQPSNRPASVFAFVKRVTRPSLALHPSSILGLAVVRLDLVVLALLAGRVAVAYYSLAVAASEAASLIPSAIGLANYSDVARQSSDSARGATIARAKRATVVALAVAIFVATVARFSLGRVLPAQYSHALPALYIALAGTCVYSVSWVLMPYIAVTRTRMITASVATATLAVNMILLVPLADRFGATGAAIASSIAYTTGTLMNCVVFVVARRSHPDKAEVANQGDQSLPMPGLASR